MSSEPLYLKMFSPNSSNPNELKIVESDVFGVKAYQFNRSGLDKLSKMDDADKDSPAIYFLFTPHNVDDVEFSEEGTPVKRLYVGKSVNGIARPLNHRTGKDFWSEGVMFVNRMGVWNSDTITELETYFIRYFLGTSYVLENGNGGNESRLVSKSELYTFGKHVEMVIQLLQALNYNAYKVRAKDEMITRGDLNSGELYKFKNFESYLLVDNDTYTLLEGSLIQRPNKDLNALPKSDAIMIPKLLDFVDGLIKQGIAEKTSYDDNVYRLKEGVGVSSKSFAGSLVSGYRVGATLWLPTASDKIEV